MDDVSLRINEHDRLAAIAHAAIRPCSQNPDAPPVDGLEVKFVGHHHSHLTRRQVEITENQFGKGIAVLELYLREIDGGVPGIHQFDELQIEPVAEIESIVHDLRDPQ